LDIRVTVVLLELEESKVLSEKLVLLEKMAKTEGKDLMADLESKDPLAKTEFPAFKERKDIKVPLAPLAPTERTEPLEFLASTEDPESTADKDLKATEALLLLAVSVKPTDSEAVYYPFTTVPLSMAKKDFADWHSRLPIRIAPVFSPRTTMERDLAAVKHFAILSLTSPLALNPSISIRPTKLLACVTFLMK